jgi:hypothetical protein
MLFASWWRRLTASKGKVTGRRPAVRLQVEALEERTVLSGTIYTNERDALGEVISLTQKACGNPGQYVPMFLKGDDLNAVAWFQASPQGVPAWQDIWDARAWLTEALTAYNNQEFAAGDKLVTAADQKVNEAEQIRQQLPLPTLQGGVGISDAAQAPAPLQGFGATSWVVSAVQFNFNQGQEGYGLNQFLKSLISQYPNTDPGVLEAYVNSVAARINAAVKKAGRRLERLDQAAGQHHILRKRTTTGNIWGQPDGHGGYTIHVQLYGSSTWDKLLNTELKADGLL